MQQVKFPALVIWTCLTRRRNSETAVYQPENTSSTQTASTQVSSWSNPVGGVFLMDSIVDNNQILYSIRVTDVIEQSVTTALYTYH